MVLIRETAMVQRRHRTVLGDLFLAMVIAANAAYVAYLLVRLWG
jgi:hypothetical protein